MEVQMTYVQPVMTPDEAEAAAIVFRSVLRKQVLVDHDADKLRGALEAIEHAPRVKGPGENAMGKFARRSPESRKAALRNFPRSGTQKLRVLRTVQASVTGLTRDEVSARTGMPPNVATPRVLELVQGGWLVDKRSDETGERITRKTRTGADAVVLVITERAKGELRALDERSARRRSPLAGAV